MFTVHDNTTHIGRELIKAANDYVSLELESGEGSGAEAFFADFSAGLWSFDEYWIIRMLVPIYYAARTGGMSRDECFKEHTKILKTFERWNEEDKK